MIDTYLITQWHSTRDYNVGEQIDVERRIEQSVGSVDCWLGFDERFIKDWICVFYRDEEDLLKEEERGRPSNPNGSKNASATPQHSQSQSQAFKSLKKLMSNSEGVRKHFFFW